MDRLLREPHPFGAGGAPPVAPPQPRRVAPPSPAPGAQPAPVRPEPVPPPRRVTQEAPPRAAPPRTAPAERQVPDRAEEVLGGILSEVRLGALFHDEGPFSHNKEGGFDGNVELLFVSPDLLDIIWGAITESCVRR